MERSSSKTESTTTVIQIQDKEDIYLYRNRLAQYESVQRSKQISKHTDKAYQPEALILARLMEKEYLFLGQGWLVNNICAEIRRKYQKEDIHVWPWVDQLLPSKYKNNDSKYMRTAEQSSIQSSSPLDDRIEQSSSSILPVSFIPSSSQTVTHAYADMSKAMVEYTPVSQISDAYSIAKKTVQQLEKRAKLEHVALELDSQSSHIDQINDSRTEERTPVTTDMPKPHGSLAKEAIKETMQCIQEIYDRLDEFPPEILARDEDIAAGFKTLNNLFASALDLKYSKSWLDWFRTEKNRDIFGKHAAAVMSYSLTNLCAECSDEKKREWIRMDPVYAYQYSSFECLRCKYQMDAVCPACNLPMKERTKPIIAWECSNCNNRTPIKRDLTREQVGDKSNITVDFAIQVLEHIPFLISFFVWYAEWIEPYVAGRRTRLSEDLSEQA